MAEIDLSELMRQKIYLAIADPAAEFVSLITDQGGSVQVLGVRIGDGAFNFNPSSVLTQRIIDILLDDTDLPLTPYFAMMKDQSGAVVWGIDLQTGAFDFIPSADVIDKIVQGTSFGPEGVTGTFDDLQIIYPALQVSDRTRLFHALDDAGLEHRYIVRSDIPQVLALEATAGPIEMIVATGESTAAGGGDDSTMNLTTAPETHRCIMFSGETNGGTMGIQASPFASGGVVGFEPALETNAYGKGETHLTALGAWRDAQIVANSRQRRTFLLRTHAQRGDTIAQISLGTEPYNNGLAEIARAVELADLLYRREVIVRQVFLTTGVNDRADGTTRTEMRDATIAMCDDYNAAIPPITGQDDTVIIPLILDQVRAPANSLAYGADVALGQLDAIEADNRILLVAPEYFLQGAYGLSDPVHDLGPGYDVRGEYKAKLLYDLQDAASPIAYTDWKGCRPASVALTTGTEIDVTFYVPVSPLVLDTTSLPNFGNYGFTYSDTEGGITISSVALLDTDTVRITVSADISGHSNRTIGYADAESGAAEQTDRAKVWGNLRDSETRESRVIAGLKLYNWSAIFRKVF